MTDSRARPSAGADAYQLGYAQRWGHLHHPPVRALAWLLDAPDLLDPAAPHWQGRIATLGPVKADVADWLAALDRDPAPLDAALGARHYSRLGLYAEKLLAFYFSQQHILVAHGLQVRASRNDTVGEFDFLVRAGAALLHLEFATKFYLLDAATAGADFNGLIGPNLADTLGAKMRKIFDKQLALAAHPAAQPLLPQPVDRAQALVKGWLFYPFDQAPAVTEGISREHCQGFWTPLAQLDALPGERFCLMPRLQWLAPLKTPAGTAMDRQELQAALTEQMAQVAAPVMVAVVRQEGAWWLEQRRGFIVPDDWRTRAAQHRRDGTLPALS
ncbi:DUF1853 family protein [Duganella sp. Leaf126]|uniref:DUF1853 family protein n=1 Tax=Duganella sp. Leaf126 TaxID=1736266 RepID=UPI000A5A78EB|nr:DUF1853 family protein [Duganella sp. Leaf126]